MRPRRRLDLVILAIWIIFVFFLFHYQHTKGEESWEVLDRVLPYEMENEDLPYHYKNGEDVVGGPEVPLIPIGQKETKEEEHEEALTTAEVGSKTMMPQAGSMTADELHMGTTSAPASISPSTLWTSVSWTVESLVFTLTPSPLLRWHQRSRTGLHQLTHHLLFQAVSRSLARLQARTLVGLHLSLPMPNAWSEVVRIE
ncbi:hypothetical protein BDV96DRAFT_309100 [Lophiotrema nucula]|uniref:Uncharacterized protein n=1 Tax=Lophiotrema nucula TaxID=690887 RepID=A0A6A5YJ38_9PLEO|nr:hypothetical protein BDV96DRAFT_309100 [Lophiotrema nucula]